MLDHGTEVKYHVELVLIMLNIIIDDVNIIIDDVEGCRMMLITIIIAEFVALKKYIILASQPASQPAGGGRE